MAVVLVLDCSGSDLGFCLGSVILKPGLPFWLLGHFLIEEDGVSWIRVFLEGVLGNLVERTEEQKGLRKWERCECFRSGRNDMDEKR